MKKKKFVFAVIWIIMTAMVAASTGITAENGEIFKGDQVDAGLRTNAAENNITAMQSDFADSEGVRFTVNINTASEYELMTILPGIGEKRAKAIIEHREIVGGFRSVDELLEVEGIGKGIMEQVRPYCRIEGPAIQYSHVADAE